MPRKQAKHDSQFVYLVIKEVKRIIKQEKLDYNTALEKASAEIGVLASTIDGWMQQEGKFLRAARKKVDFSAFQKPARKKMKAKTPKVESRLKLNFTENNEIRIKIDQDNIVITMDHLQLKLTPGTIIDITNAECIQINGTT